jgi:branched-subunit amino acid aminotransferase/4-amino-4-deoxychorismate lyase
LKIDDLKNADEIFLTSSWLGIMPAASFEDRTLPDKLIAGEMRTEYEQTLVTSSS